VVVSLAPGSPTTWTRRGNTTVGLLSSSKPTPPGRNASVWSSTTRQRPGVAGETLGRTRPSARSTGLENVRRSSRPGAILSPGLGETSSCVYGFAGNHRIRVGFESCSHERAAAATTTEPTAFEPRTPRATFARGCTRRRSGSPGPSQTTRTGRSNPIVTGSPSFTCSHRPRRCAVGVTTENRRVSVRPTSQPAQPGRRTVTSTLSGSPASSVRSGQTSPCRSRTATRAPSARRTLTATVPA
jgi:hypothetical protein